jgi:hypothetical protein
MDLTVIVHQSVKETIQVRLIICGPLLDYVDCHRQGCPPTLLLFERDDMGVQCGLHLGDVGAQLGHLVDQLGCQWRHILAKGWLLARCRSI